MSMDKPRVYHDLQKQDDHGRIKLTLLGTLRDLERHGIVLREGLPLAFWCDDADDRGEFDEIHIEGVVHYNDDEKCWVAELDWDSFRHASDERDRSDSSPSCPEWGAPPE
jgi:hypothetical protein